MGIFLTADSLKPTSHGVQQSYAYGPGAAYGPPTLIDTARDGESGSLTGGALSSQGIFQRDPAGPLYKLLNRQQAPVGSCICKSTDNGLTWAVLDSANSPLFQNLNGYYDPVTDRLICALNNAGAINLISFNLATELWGIAVAGGPAIAASMPIIYVRPDGSYLIIYQDRNTFPGSGTSGIAGVDYTVGVWGAAFDVGAGMLPLLGWDASQTLAQPGTSSRSVMDAAGIVHVFWAVTSLQLVPRIWANRCFYQAVKLDNSLGSFFDFPGQSTLNAGKQDLVAYSGIPLGRPVIVSSGGVDTIVLPVLQTNRSLVDSFPRQIASIYLGAPASNVGAGWTIDPAKTIDPGCLLDDTILPQESPYCLYDPAGPTLYAVFPAQDANGQDFARLRLCQTSNLASPTDDWTAATAFDLQVDPSAPGFQFATQELLEPAISLTAEALPDLPAFKQIDANGLRVVMLPDPTRDCS